MFLEFASVYVFKLFLTLPERNSLCFRQFCWKISKTYSEFQIPSDWIKLHPLIFLQVVSALSSGSKNPTFYMIFYVKVARSSFLRGAIQKASIAHLCTAPRAPPCHLLPPPATSHHERLCITNGTREAFYSQEGMYCCCIIISLCVLQKESLVLIDFSWRKVIFHIRDWQRLMPPYSFLFI
jgi:hypothetical protein